MKCKECNFDYPSELLNPLFINGTYTKPICGICAEKLIGIPLRGEQAVYMKERAQEHRKGKQA